MIEKIKILLVEDNPADADLTRETMENCKILYDIWVVEDGIAAMEFLHRQGGYQNVPRPDIILLDLNLPRKDGREVLADIKTDPALRRIPVVVLTSSQAEEDIIKSYDLQANAYITKPVDLNGFGKIVKAIEGFWFFSGTLSTGDFAMNPAINVLLIEDNPGDADLIREYITGDTKQPVEIYVASTLAASVGFLKRGGFDIILLDLNLPDSAGIDTFSAIHAVAPKIPVIVVTGAEDDEMALQCMEHGAQDYLPKQWINRSLAMTIRNTLTRVQTEVHLVRAHNSTSRLVESNPDGILVLAADQKIQYANSAAIALFGRELLGEIFEVPPTPFAQMTIQCRSGVINTVEVLISQVSWNNAQAVMVTLRDITDLKQARDSAAHLIHVLRGVRNVNQLIIRENDRNRLIQSACDILTQELSYDSVWIALLNENGTIAVIAGSNVGKSFTTVKEQIRNDHLLPNCIARALKGPGTLLLYPAVDCPDCPMARHDTEFFSLTQRLESHGKVYGVIVVYISPTFAQSEEEKGLFEELADDISYALHKMEVERQVEELSRFPAENPNPVIRFLPEGTVVYANRAAALLLKEIEATADMDNLWKRKISASVASGLMNEFEVAVDDRYFQVQLVPICDHGYVNLYARDITERKHFEFARQQALRETQSLLKASRAVLLEPDFPRVARIIFNICAEHIKAPAGYVALLSSDGNYNEVVFLDAGNRECLVDPNSLMPLRGLRVEAYDKGQGVFDNNFRESHFQKFLPQGHVDLDNVLFAPLNLDGHAVGLIGLANKTGGFTEQDVRMAEAFGEIMAIALRGHRVKQALQKSEEQLRQSNKLEAVGRLAGGVAHDFNNMLNVILGYAEIITTKLHPGDPLLKLVEQISKAGNRSADLARQLLAFSRKQTLQPKIIDLNAVIRDIDKMLRRLIGEDIELESVLSDDISRVEVDQSQIQQVLMNLALNARDAMPEGGKLTIETADIEIDADYAQKHVGVMPGRYVLLTMTDTGCGMSADILQHVFEPFYTTKEPGKGTGLGLATVYGIVKQSGGQIWVL